MHGNLLVKSWSVNNLLHQEIAIENQGMDVGSGTGIAERGMGIHR
jgi:hypothetical protein